MSVTRSPHTLGRVGVFYAEFGFTIHAVALFYSPAVKAKETKKCLHRDVDDR
jgi:hypothetical protein